MKPFCEVIVSTILPAIRSIITKELLGTYKLTQEEAARLLGLTQPAISQYYRESRGFKVKLLEKNASIMEIIDELTKKIALKKLNQKDINTELCRICKRMREERIVCHLHEDVYPSIAPCFECPEV